jgi:hypothetical protein
MERGQKKGLFTLLDKAWSSFKELKRAFASPPILRHFNPTRLVKVITNASRFVITRILLQPINGIAVPQKQSNWQLVAFFSQKLTEVEA